MFGDNTNIMLMFCWIAEAPVDNVAAKPHSSRPAETASSHNGLFDDDDEDLFTPAASKPTGGNKKGRCRSVLTCPGCTQLHSFNVSSPSSDIVIPLMSV